LFYRLLALECGKPPRLLSDGWDDIMKRAIAGATLLIALAVPALAANTPQELLQRLTQAAREGDSRGFVSNLSSTSQREFANLETAKTQLYQAQQSFAAALDQRFGKGHFPSRTLGVQDGLKPVLARLVNLELLNTRQEGPNQLQLELKTLNRDSKGREVSEEDTFTAVREQGRWKLDLTNLARGTRQITSAQTAAFNTVVGQVRIGAFTDDVSAMVALAKMEKSVLREAYR
jgi:hypothetical protein